MVKDIFFKITIGLFHYYNLFLFINWSTFAVYSVFLCPTEKKDKKQSEFLGTFNKRICLLQSIYIGYHKLRKNHKNCDNSLKNNPNRIKFKYVAK